MTTYSIRATETVEHHWTATVEAGSLGEAQKIVEAHLQDGAIADLQDATETGTTFVTDEIDWIGERR